MNLLPAVTACNLKEPDEALAGDRLSEAIAAASATIDSLELQLEELGGGETGSNLRDSLKMRINLNKITSRINNIRFYSLVLVILDEFLQFFDVPDGIQIILYMAYNRQMRVIRMLIIRDDPKNIVHF